VPFLAWFGVHYAINGYPFNPPGLTGRGGYESAYAAAKQWAAVNLVLLVEDWRFLLSAGAVLAVAMLLLTGRPASSRQTGSTMWLMASTIPACTTAICMGVTVLMRRYLLPALPAYYAVTYLPIRHCRRSAAYVIGSAVIGLQVWSWFTPTAPSLPVDIGEASPMQSPTDWRYRDILYCHRNAAAFLSDNWHHASILTHEPFIRELTISDIGYVREPLRAVRYSQDQRLLSQRFDVICVETDSPWPSGKPLLEAVTEALNKGTLIQVTAFERRWCRVVVLRRSGVATR